MSCVGIRTLSFVVASMLASLCFIVALIDLTLMGMFFWDTDFQNSRNHDAVKDFAVQYFFIVLLTSVCGFITAILFIAGIRKNCLSKVTPLVYWTGGCIVFMGVSILCMYVADLIKAPSYAHAVLEFIENSLGLAILILFTTPIFLTYKRMSASMIQVDQLCLSTDQSTHKSNHHYDDNM